MRIERLVLLHCFCHLRSVFGAPNKSRVLAPVANLEESIAASTALRTTLAIALSDRCCLLISRVPKQEASSLEVTSEQEHEDDSDRVEMEGLPVRDCGVSVDRNQWMSQLTRSTVLCMTGFAADVAHLTGVITREVVSYQAVYEKPRPVQKTIRSIAHLLRLATHSAGDGGRPFGVAAMALGRSSNSDTWRIYTVDPSATWRAPGGKVAVIGRSATAIEKKLRESLLPIDRDQDRLAQQCLQISLQSVLQTLYDEENLIDSESFECLLLVGNGKGCKVWSVDSGYVQKEVENCVKQVMEAENSS